MAEFAIYNESCIETMRRMAENSLDAIVTDPPYGLSNHSEKDVRKCLKAWLSGVEYAHGKSGFMGKCFHPDTDVLTDNGWKNIRAITTNDLVVSRSELGEIQLSPVASLHEYDFDGHLLGVGGRSAMQLVTPNHRIVTDRGVFRADELPRNFKLLSGGVHGGIDVDEVAIGGKIYPSGPLFRFIGLFIGDGSAVERVSQPQKQDFITISAKKSRKIELFNSTLSELGVRFKRNDSRGYSCFYVYDKPLLSELRNLGKATQKYIPNWCFAYSTRLLGQLFDGLISTDGCIQGGNQPVYSTSSRRLADDFQRLCIYLDRSACMTVHGEKGSSVTINGRVTALTTDHYRLSVTRLSPRFCIERDGRADRAQPAGVKHVEYSGKVYCLTLGKHSVLMTRYNGRPVWSGNSWDSWVPGPECWREAYRVLKPGGYMLVFSSTRTQDLMGIALRLAGFTMHPAIYYAFGSGFPKATNLSKMIDKAAGAEREVVGARDWSNARMESGRGVSGLRQSGGFAGEYNHDRVQVPITAPATDLAKQWDGWFYGLQSLKPAVEPILMVQKPPVGRMVDNVEQYGVGAINVDGCRVATTDTYSYPNGAGGSSFSVGAGVDGTRIDTPTMHASGRWPANLILSGEDEVVALFPETGPSSARPRHNGEFKSVAKGIQTPHTTFGYDDSGGSAARFFKQCEQDDDSDEFVRLFYSAKASKRDRDEGLDAFDEQRCGGMQATADGSMLTGSGNASVTARANHHPTVKPTSLMAYLVRLVTPPGGTVYDPFGGSFTTAKAALIQGFNFIGSEIQEEFCEIGMARAQHAIDNADELRDKYCSSKSSTKAPKVKQGKQKSKPGEMASLF